MIPYYLLLFLPVLLSVLTSFFKNIKRELPCTVFFIILLLLLSLRDITVGGDLLSYQRVFDYSQDLSYGVIMTGDAVVGFEWGWVLFNRFVGFFTSSFQTFMIVCATLSVIPVFVLYRKYTADTILTIALFISLSFFTSYFSGLRQALAMAFVPLAFYFTKSKRLIFFFLTAVLATLIHNSAFVIFLLYPVYHMHIPRSAAFFIIPFFFIVYAFRTTLFPFFQGLLWDKYNEYEMTDTGAVMVLVLLLLFVILSYTCLAEDDKLDKEIISFRNILILSALLQIFASVNTVAMRLNYYYLLLVPIAVPSIINSVKPSCKTIMKVLSIALIVVCYVKFIRGAYVGEDLAQIFPYIPFWEGHF